MFRCGPRETFGRLCPFRYEWRVAADSGRKTVWNNTTRGPRLATYIFNGEDIRQGLLPNAPGIMARRCDRLPSREGMTALLLRDKEFGDDDNWATAEAQLLGCPASWYRWSRTRGLGSGWPLPLRRRPSSMLVEGT